MRETLPDRVRLGVFEVDLRAGELRNGERAIYLQEQPLSVLRMLVERGGDLVTREELKQKLWPNDTVVDFDQGINAAVRRLRLALGDSADEPRYLATIARRGYRLLLPVEALQPTRGIPQGKVTDLEAAARERSRHSASTRRTQPLIAGLVLLVLCAIAIFALRSRRIQEPPAAKIEVHQLSSGGPDSRVMDQIALSPDGKLLAYSGEANGLTLLQVDTGESRSFLNTSTLRLISWLPDEKQLVVSALGKEGTWTISTVDGNVQKLRAETIAPVFSPDGRRMAFFQDNAIWVEETGTNARRLAAFDPLWSLEFVTWSADGKRIAFDRQRNLQPDMSNAWGQPFEIRLDTCDLAGRCSTVLSDPRLFMDTTFSDLVWLPDGHIIFTLREPTPDEHSSNLWSLQVDPDTGQTQGVPRRLTDWSGFELGSLSASGDGKRLALLQKHVDTRIDIAQLQDDGLELQAPEPLNSDTWYGRPVSWTADGRGLLFLATRHGRNGIFRQNINDRAVQTLVSGAASYSAVAISPDEKWLLYAERTAGGGERLMRQPLGGGTASVLLDGTYGCRCAVAPANRCVLSEFKGDRVTFSELDPFVGRGRELGSIRVRGLTYGWSLSADGSKIVFVTAGENEQVRILEVDGTQHVIPLKGWSSLQSANWSHDGRRLYVSGGRDSAPGQINWALLEVDLSGKSTVLREVSSTQGWLAHPLPSPDGHHLAYTRWDFSSRMVMLENF